MSRNEVAKWLEARRDEVAATWRENLNRVAISAPAAAQPIIDTLRTALADILISRDGAALRPGTRSYARSWIRDGAMMSAALLRLGHEDAAREYLAWYAPYQFKNGKVPCCVDARGSDPVPENDSHGELIYLAIRSIATPVTVRCSSRRGRTSTPPCATWTSFARRAHRRESQRRSSRILRIDACVDQPRRLFGQTDAFVLGRFWSLVGYKDAARIAEALGNSDAAARIARSRDEFHTDLSASIRQAVADHHIDYLPGCAESATSTRHRRRLPFRPPASSRICRRISPPPRSIATGRSSRSAATASLRGRIIRRRMAHGRNFRSAGLARTRTGSDRLLHARPAPCRMDQWAEVVGRDPRESRFVGDSHTAGSLRISSGRFSTSLLTNGNPTLHS